MTKQNMGSEERLRREIAALEGILGEADRGEIEFVRQMVEHRKALLRQMARRLDKPNS